ncbi:hypothetical protein [Pseudoalteromonas sp. ASV78]|uniref:hypothetical protein n=1 Tax=Pseudoalteromonas sp. ASV78 TaxID=3397851 RepID=UPI0039FC5936
MQRCTVISSAELNIKSATAYFIREVNGVGIYNLRLHTERDFYVLCDINTMSPIDFVGEEYTENMAHIVAPGVTINTL